MRICSKCGEFKPETDEYFSRQKLGKNGLRASCKVCEAQYHQAHKEEAREARLARRRADPLAVSRRHRVERYAAAWDEFDRFMLSQGGACGICGFKHADSFKGLHLDHDHKTGKVRGLLCCACNLALGRNRAKHGFQDAAALWECGFVK